MKKYFVYDPNNGFHFCESLDDAKSVADEILCEYRDDAADYGWDENVTDICYGKIAGRVIENSRKPAPNGSPHDEILDFGFVGDES